MNRYKINAVWSDGGKWESAWTTAESVESWASSIVRNLEDGTSVEIKVRTLPVTN